MESLSLRPLLELRTKVVETRKSRSAPAIRSPLPTSRNHLLKTSLTNHGRLGCFKLRLYQAALDTASNFAPAWDRYRTSSIPLPHYGFASCKSPRLPLGRHPSRSVARCQAPKSSSAVVPTSNELVARKPSMPAAPTGNGQNTSLGLPMNPLRPLSSKGCAKSSNAFDTVLTLLAGVVRHQRQLAQQLHSMTTSQGCGLSR